MGVRRHGCGSADLLQNGSRRTVCVFPSGRRCRRERHPAGYSDRSPDRLPFSADARRFRVRHIQRQQNATGVGKTLEIPAVPGFPDKTGRKRQIRIFASETIKTAAWIRQKSIRIFSNGNGNMGIRRGGEQTDDPGENGSGSGQQKINGFHEDTFPKQ